MENTMAENEEKKDVQEEQKAESVPSTEGQSKTKTTKSKSTSKSSLNQAQTPHQEEACQNQQLPPPPQGGQQQQIIPPQGGYYQQQVPPNWGYQQPLPPMPTQPAQVVVTTATERSWLQRNIFAVIFGFVFALVLCAVFAITANTSYNQGFDTGKRAGVEETRGTYAKSPWYSRLGSAVTGELPK